MHYKSYFSKEICLVKTCLFTKIFVFAYFSFLNLSNVSKRSILIVDVRMFKKKTGCLKKFFTLLLQAEMLNL